MRPDTESMECSWRRRFKTEAWLRFSLQSIGDEQADLNVFQFLGFIVVWTAAVGFIVVQFKVQRILIVKQTSISNYGTKCPTVSYSAFLGVDLHKVLENRGFVVEHMCTELTKIIFHSGTEWWLQSSGFKNIPVTRCKHSNRFQTTNEVIVRNLDMIMKAAKRMKYSATFVGLAISFQPSERLVIMDEKISDMGNKEIGIRCVVCSYWWMWRCANSIRTVYRYKER